MVSLAAARGLRHLGVAPETLAALFPLRCPLALFGFRCPTCGLGRSLVAAWMGRWEDSWSFHPLGVILLAVSIAAVVVAWTQRSVEA